MPKALVRQFCKNELALDFGRGDEQVVGWNDMLSMELQAMQFCRDVAGKLPGAAIYIGRVDYAKHVSHKVLTPELVANRF